jgi:hypothetical protein
VKIHYMVQYSPTWWETRCGFPSASAFDRILTPTGKLSAQAEGYIDELIADRCQLSPNFFTERPMSREMANGRDMEPEARRWYQMERPDSLVQQVGGCVSACGRFWASPDGLVDDDGVLELKCPMLKTQVEYLRLDTLPANYRPQVHGQLFVTGRKYVDFASYAPGLPGFIVRVEPDEYTAKLAVALEDFHRLYVETVKRIAPHLLEASHDV